MYRIIGLGNVGEEHQDTAHNIGADIVKLLINKKSKEFIPFSSRFDNKRKSDIFSGEIQGEKVEFILFKNYMNNSGDAFNGIFSKENESEKSDIIVIHDDVDLPFGEIRISFDRGDGGHNGVKDIMAKIDTKEFIRIRVGVCPLGFTGKCRKPKSGEALNKYLVYKQLSKKYTEKYVDYANKIDEILDEIVENGYHRAMNKFN